MPVPWLQIVQLVPSIVEVSRELLKKTNRPAPAAPGGLQPQASREELLARIAALEENERRQAELVSQMAEQLAALSRAATLLHRRALQLGFGCAIAIVGAAVALVIALR
jgi:hypothetical protein